MTRRGHGFKGGSPGAQDAKGSKGAQGTQGAKRDKGGIKLLQPGK